jgi:hypothetical protein
MKATSIIIAVVLTLQVNLLFAGNKDTKSTANNETSFCPTCILAPVTPTEATFEETTEPNAFSLDLTSLAPVTPVEADFNDVVPEKNLDVTILAPTTPTEADFNEPIEAQAFNLTNLAPVTPSEADFE